VQLKKILLYHFIPLVIACSALYSFKKPIDTYHSSKDPFEVKRLNDVHYIDHFYDNNVSNQLTLSVAFKKGIPVLFGSSELTSGHLRGLAQNYFTKEQKTEFLAFGHAGFQSFAVMTVLAANRELLRDSRLTLIISPGWFEKQYCKGTSLSCFFEYCKPNYLFQIYTDWNLDKETHNYIFNYINCNYDKISSPNSLMRLAANENNIFKFPFNYFDNKIFSYQYQSDAYLVSQRLIIDKLNRNSNPYNFLCHKENWDSLFSASKATFKSISNNNDIGVENSYYDQWLKGKPKKHLAIIPESNNRELKDFKALITFLKNNDIKPLFVITPLNYKAHENLDDLAPTMKKVADILKEGDFKTLDLFSANLKNYEDGILEDIMHPYDYGWYKIDRFIIDNYAKH
jgi:poly-D-alanine transfer protein DltD